MPWAQTKQYYILFILINGLQVKFSIDSDSKHHHDFHTQFYLYNHFLFKLFYLQKSFFS